MNFISISVSVESLVLWESPRKAIPLKGGYAKEKQNPEVKLVSITGAYVTHASLSKIEEDLSYFFNIRSFYNIGILYSEHGLLLK